MYLEQFGLLKK